MVSELHADLDALVMLLSSDAPTVANVLVADRVIREAWLKRPYAQVDAVAARQLLGLLIRWRAITLTDTDQVRLNLTRARSRLTEELERVRELERRCLREGSEAALNYLRESGWQIIGKNCHRESTSRLGRYLAWSSVRR
ncbi:hypothetical protein AB0F97_25645 [Nocardiopsis alba]|uniref:hypothetical protein n=1 Tax=Nocardiopsis alba TaxID=53437 RepID=UPI0033F33B4E